MFPYSGVLPPLYRVARLCSAKRRCLAVPLGLKGVPLGLKGVPLGLKDAPLGLKDEPPELKDAPPGLKGVSWGWVERPDLVEVLNSVGY